MRGLSLATLAVLSAGDYVGGTRAFFALSDLVINLLAFFKCGVTTRLYLRVVDEQVISALVGGDKSEALFLAKPFYCTCTHYFTPSAFNNGHKKKPVSLVLF